MWYLLREGYWHIHGHSYYLTEERTNPIQYNTIVPRSYQWSTNTMKYLLRNHRLIPLRGRPELVSWQYNISPCGRTLLSYTGCPRRLLETNCRSFFRTWVKRLKFLVLWRLLDPFENFSVTRGILWSHTHWGTKDGKLWDSSLRTIQFGSED